MIDNQKKNKPDYFREVSRLAFLWTWHAVTRRFFLPAFSDRLIMARLKWVGSGEL